MTPGTIAHQAPLSMGFPRQEYWSGLTFPSPGDLPDPGIKPESPVLKADSLLSELPGKSHVSCSAVFDALRWHGLRNNQSDPYVIINSRFT